jgi:hypothetical protein
MLQFIRKRPRKTLDCGQARRFILFVFESRETMNTRVRLACVAVALLAGCAAQPPAPRAEHAAPDGALHSCAEWYRALDAKVARAGVRDAEDARLPGYPYLRLDRFTASFAPQAKQDPAAFDAWFARARALDRAAREVELRNLPRAALPEGVDAALARDAGCAPILAAGNLADAPARERLLAQAVVPDDYDPTARVIGLYPLAALPFSNGVARWQAETVAAFRATSRGAPPAAPLVRYAPTAGDPLSQAQLGALLARAPRDALGVPRFTAQEIDRLFARFAPVYEIETGGEFDHPGAPTWTRAPVAQIDSARPSVYRRLAYTRDGKDVLVQLVYTIWFSERPGEDILAGKIDGLVWRVTLAADGAPLVYDSIHPCGCFHQFFPTARVAAKPAPEPLIEWAFVPRPAPPLAPGERIVLRVATRTHYLKGLAAEPRERAAAATPLALADEDALRSLALPGGGRRSLYGPDGLVAGSERAEREYFWPMGIASAGQMRQWGRQATAFVGKRHFDDADLIALRFRLLAP